jgi:pantetheine-phosphate adenylyltransferase
MTAEKRIAVYPGSFDPLTRGHLDLIRRGARLFDRLVVAVLVNPEKEPFLTEAERVELIAREVRSEPRVEVRAFGGLVAHLAAEVGARWLLRGVRSASDLEFELPMAHSNHLLEEPGVETVFLPARPELAFISSRLVREIARSGGDLRPFVTPAVAKRLMARVRGRP